MKFCSFICCLGLGLLIRPASAAPNILFIYTDDQAAWTVGAYGNDQAHTPNLDRLASEGVRMTQAFSVTPVCSPSRAELMTSRYGTELGIVDFLPDANHKLGHDASVGLSPDIPSFPQVLGKGGYQNALIGKWHLGYTERFHPTENGFEYFAGFQGGGTSVKDPSLEVNGEIKKYEGLTGDLLTEQAIGFLRQRDEKRPFFLAVHYRSPHAAWTPVAPEDAAPYKGKDMRLPEPDYPDLDTKRIKRMMAEYLASVSGVDRNVGQLLATLKELALVENTIVIFSADHGYNMGHNGIHHKGNGIWATKKPPVILPDIDPKYRPNLYDQSMHVPLLVRWPGVVQAGSVRDQVVTNLDWFPTLVSMAGLKMPDGITVRGRDFTPLLKGENIPWDPELYGEYSMTNYAIADMRCLRTPDWKLVVDFHNRERDELYDLKNDPAENHNLIADSRAEVQAMKQKLFDRLLARKQALSPPPPAQ